MTVPSAAAPGRSPFEREIEARRAEQEMGAMESELFAEMSRLDETARAIGARLQQVKTLAAQLEMGGLQGGELQAISQRLRATAVSRPAVDGPREQALAARLQALRARKQASEQLRQVLEAHGAELERLSNQAAADEAALRTLVQRHREAAAEQQRRQAAEEAARRAAMARAPVPAPAPRASPPGPAAPPGLVSTQVASPRTMARPGAQPQAPVPAGRPEARARRVRMQAAVDFHSEHNFFQGFSTNLGEGGLFVATVQTLPRGTPVDLHFSLPDGCKVDLKGVVRWVRESNDQTPDIFPGVGVQFTDLTPEATEAIKKFVAAREPMFFPD